MRTDAVYVGSVSRRIQRLLATHRTKAMKVDDGDQHWALVPDNLSELASRAIIGIPTLGCTYARTPWGGCAVCGHSASSLWNADLSIELMVEDVDRSLQAVDRAAKPAHFCLYTSGSFLDDREMPAAARAAILERVSSRAWVQSISIESLPQYITSRSLEALRAHSGSLSINLGMGLDSSDDFIRAVCFQRHIPSSSYIKALRACEANGVVTTAYVVHKPPFLSEREAVFDTSHSIARAFAWGFDRVSIEPVALQEGTLQQWLFAKGLYVPPTFWSVVSAIVASGISATEAAKRILLGGQVFTPLPTRVLRGCSDCRCKAKPYIGEASVIFDSVCRGEHSVACGTTGIESGIPIDEEVLLRRITELLDELARTPLGSDKIWKWGQR